MTYTIAPNTITKINETSGVIQNTNQIEKIELSSNADFTDSFILYPLQTFTFTRQIYAKLFDSGGLPAELRVSNFISISGGNSSSSTTPSGIATDAEFETMLDEVLSGNNSDTATTPSNGGTVTINGEVHNVISDKDFNSMLDDVGL